MSGRRRQRWKKKEKVPGQFVPADALPVIDSLLVGVCFVCFLKVCVSFQWKCFCTPDVTTALLTCVKFKEVQNDYLCVFYLLQLFLSFAFFKKKQNYPSDPKATK